MLSSSNVFFLVPRILVGIFKFIEFIRSSYFEFLFPHSLPLRPFYMIVTHTRYVLCLGFHLCSSVPTCFVHLERPTFLTFSFGIIRSQIFTFRLCSFFIFRARVPGVPGSLPLLDPSIPHGPVDRPSPPLHDASCGSQISRTQLISVTVVRSS